MVSPADPKQCTAVGDGIKFGIVGEENEVTVKTVYHNGQPCLENQDLKTELRLTLPSSEPLDCSISNKKDAKGLYLLSYKTNSRGKHILSVTLNGVSIANSPFKLMMYINPKAKITTPHKTLIENLNQPYQIAFMANNDMLVTLHEKVIKLTGDDTKHATTFGKDLPKSPTGIAADEEGFVYISYEDSGHIIKYDRDGKKQGERNGLDRPGRLFYSKVSKKIYVCNREQKNVHIFNTDLSPSSCIAENVRCSDITCDDDGTIFVADKNRGAIHKFSESGENLGLLFQRGYLNAPRGLCLQNNHMFISDRDNSRIVIVKINSGNATEFNELKMKDHDIGSITTDNHGYIYICNQRKNKILVL